jgi:protease I
MNALIVVSKNGFQPKEYLDTRTELEKAGIDVSVCSLSSGKAVSSDGMSIDVDISLDEAEENVDSFDSLVIIGGPGASVDIVGNPLVHEIVRKFYDDGKVVAAICISPVALAESGILEGKKASVWNGDSKQKSVIEKYGAKFVLDDVCVCGRIVTANGPMAALKFGKAVSLKMKEQV